MSACETCRGDVFTEHRGCAVCTVDVEPAMFDRIEATDDWKRAPTHRVRSSTGVWMLALGLALAATDVYLAVTYDELLALVIAWGIFAAVCIAGGAYFLSGTLEPRGGVVLTISSSQTSDSRGSTSTSYQLYLATRAGTRKLAVPSRLIADLAPGTPVIVFIRRGGIDDLWRPAH